METFFSPLFILSSQYLPSTNLLVWGEGGSMMCCALALACQSLILFSRPPQIHRCMRTINAAVRYIPSIPSSPTATQPFFLLWGVQWSYVSMAPSESNTCDVWLESRATRLTWLMTSSVLFSQINQKDKQGCTVWFSKANAVVCSS